MTQPASPELLITRTVQAPRDLLFKAWTEPARLARWWGPKGMAVEVEALDLRPGGTFLYSMRTPDGKKLYGKYLYQDVVAPERLVFINGFCDAQGGLLRHPMSATWPLEVLNTLTLEDHGPQTLLTLRGMPWNASPAEQSTFAEARPMVEQGFAGTFGQLEAYLATL